MASVSNVLRTCGLLFYLIFQTHASVVKTPDLIIHSLKVGSVKCVNSTCKYLLNVSGSEFLGHYPWRLTPVEGAKGGNCEIIYSNYELKEIETSQLFSKLEVSVPNVDGKIYFCLHQKAKNRPFGGEWVHQGVEHFLEPKKDVFSTQKEELSIIAEPNTNSTQTQETDTQTNKKLEDETDDDNTQMVNTEWSDLTHDTDVNYLPSVSRPTREERNDIEVMLNDKYVPLNDLIEQIKIDSKQTVNVFNNFNQVNDVDNNIKRDVIKNNFDKIIQEDKARETINRDSSKVNVNNKSKISIKTNRELNDTDEVSDTIKTLILQSNKIESIMTEISNLMYKIDALVNYTYQEMVAKCFSNDICIQRIMARSLLNTMPSLEESVEEDLQAMRNQRNRIVNIIDMDRVKLDKAKDLFDKDIDGTMNILRSSKIDKIMEEFNDINEKINALPNYKNLQIILTRCFTNYTSSTVVPPPGISLPEDLLNQRNGPENINDLNLNNVKDINGQEFYKFKPDEVFESEFPSSKIDGIVTEMKDINDKIKTLPVYTTPEKKVARCRNCKNIEKNMASNRNDISSEMSVVDISNSDKSQDVMPKIRKRRQIIPEVDFTSVRAASRMVALEGIRVEDSDKEPKIIEEGIPSVLAESSVTLRVYGEGLTPRTVIAFTHDPQPYGQPCKFLLKGEYMIKEDSLRGRTALFDIRTPSPITGSKLYICAKNLQPGVTDPNDDEEKYLHQGTETWKMLASHNKLLPLWVSISLILFCLMFSALFSGLNLGLMSLDRTELKIIANTGTEQERKYARAIMPVRDHGNYLLCSILLGNVAVNSTFTILLDELTSGLFAVIFSTLAIVMLGEITPQAICSRHGLMVGAKSIMVTKGVMAVTAPLSFPVSKLLDYFLGEEIGNVYNRERLKELVKVTTDVNDLDKDEVNIISGALEMRKKTVSDVMTKLEDVFMLPISSVLDFETMSEIVKSGYSRIPVYEGGRGNIVTVLFIKDLAFVDPDDNTPLRTLCQYYQNPAHFVFEDVTLDVIFKQFKDGHKGHMAFIHRINNEGEGDPFYETIGLVTLEDVIEEMIQAEIVDETDVFLDNRSKRRRRPQNKLQDFAAFAERHENQRIHISPQLTLATFQFLSTSVDAFRPDTVSETVLRRLLKQDVIQYIKIKGKTKKDPTTYVFQQGKPVDYFLLILEGRVEVTVGRENLVFEAGPFTYFGVQALTQNVGVAESPTPSAMGSLQNINMDAMLRHTFVPDYSVRAITSVYYLTVKRSLYLAAKRATLMEKGNISKGGTTQEFDTEVDKPLQRLNLIELMQVSKQNYPSSEKLDVSDKYLKLVGSTLAADPDKLTKMQCSNSETCRGACPERVNRTETSKSMNACSANVRPYKDVDANSCDECVKNNFWIGKTVLNKNVKDKIVDSEPCKKKKATFHTDTSLLTFHNLSSTSQTQEEIDYKSSNRELCLKSNQELPLKSHDIEFGNRAVEFKFNSNNSNYNLDYKYRDFDYKLSNTNDRFYVKNEGDSTYKQSNESCGRFRDVTTETTKSNKDSDYIQHIKNPNQIPQHHKIEYESQIESNRQLDFQLSDYKVYMETDLLNQEQKSINHEIESTDPPDSIDRLLESERDTIDYEKEFREERLSVEKRRLETEQIMMFQLSKIIKMLERNQT